MKYQVLTADKTEDVTLEAAQAALAEEYPEYKVEVHDGGHQFVAKLTAKTAADDEEEDGGDDAPEPSGKKPPFLEEKDDDAGDDEGEEPKKKPADDDGDDDSDDDDDGDKDDLGPGGDDPGASDVVKALKALKELDHVLPKLKDQLKSLNGGDDLGGAGPGGPDGIDGMVPPPPGGPGGPPGGPPAPHGGPGPTPGAPPASALPGPPAPGKGIPAPNVSHGLDQRKGPQVGPSTFSSVQDKFLNRPVANPDGSRSNLLEVTAAIVENPRYTAYYVAEVKYDEEADQWVAHLKSRS